MEHEDDFDRVDIDDETLCNEYLDELYDIYVGLHKEIKYSMPINFLNLDTYSNFIDFVDSPLYNE